MVKMSKALIRRSNLKNALIDAAEQTISREGLAGLRARSLAFEVGCAVGAIYNVVDDIDDLIFAVNERTLLALERELTAANSGETESKGAARAIEQLVAAGARLSWLCRRSRDALACVVRSSSCGRSRYSGAIPCKPAAALRLRRAAIAGAGAKRNRRATRRHGTLAVLRRPRHDFARARRKTRRRRACRSTRADRVHDEGHGARYCCGVSGHTPIARSDHNSLPHARTGALEVRRKLQG